jgi:drug/metabolite transporter (DMT)-like permease
MGQVLLKSSATPAKSSSHGRAWLQIHFCVLLWGFTAILGKLITLPALQLVWWRMFLVSAALLFVPRFWTGVRQLPPRLVAIYAGIGMLVAMHWLTFYASIKLSNASVAVTCLALAPLFIAFTEPLLTRGRVDLRELLLGIAVIPGVLLVVGGTPESMRLGMLVGGLSALLMAVFNSLNKRFADQGAALSVTGIEMGSGTAILTLATLALPAEAFVLPTPEDGVLLTILALGCTLLPFALALVAMRQLSAFSTGLVVNLEPVYAILLAIVLLGEQHELDARFYAGVAIVVLGVFSHPWLLKKGGHQK